MARLRTFIAVDLGKAIRDRCVALQESLARSGAECKWVEPENLHVTLLFLGEVVDRDVPALCKAVAEVCAKQAAFGMSVESAVSSMSWLGAGLTRMRFRLSPTSFTT